MTDRSGSERQPPQPVNPSTLIALAAVFIVFAAAALGLMGTTFWREAVLRKPANPLVLRLLSAVLAVMLTGVAAKKYFFDAKRSRRPRWQRISAVLVLLLAVYMVFRAIRGV